MENLVNVKGGYYTFSNLRRWVRLFTLVAACIPGGICQAQTYVTSGTLNSANMVGLYYNDNRITLGAGFSANGTNGTFEAYINNDCTPLANNLSQNHNYILTTTPRVAGYTNASQFLINPSTCQLMQTVQYYDGLGKPVQTIQIKGSPLGNDMVQPVIYDMFGRNTVNYLPYTLTGAAASDGSYKPTALVNGGAQSQFYTTPPPGVAIITVPQALTGFEMSPLNRVSEQGFPGTAWQLQGMGDPNSSNHTLRTIITVNDQSSTFNSVYTAGTPNPGSQVAALYTAAINSDGSRTLNRTTNATYGQGQLDITITRNENWQPANGCLNTTEEYRDKEGHVVLKRTYNLNTSNAAAPFIEMLSTYYVYDDYNDLAFVLPPMTNADAGITSAGNPDVLANLCYQYAYDERNRLTGKRIPGKGWEHMVYNQLNQPVLSQDAVQRAGNQWMVTKYDALGRVIAKGLWNAGSAIPISTLQGSIYGAAQWDARDYINNLTQNPTGYTISSYPQLSQVLAINFYDDYTFTGQPASFIAPAGATTNTRGLLTATQTTVLNTLTNTTPDMLWTAHYYDGLARSIQSYQQHYLGGVLSANNYDKLKTTYDFTNTPTTSTRQHWNAASTAAPLVTIGDTYLYDHGGRKVKTWEQVTKDTTFTTRALLSQIVYNEIGQMVNKQLHSTDSINFYQNISYTYNERGWLLGSNAPFFTEQLQYNSNLLGVANFTPLFNGNIASQTRTAGSPTATTTAYTYSYDTQNRLTSGISTDNNNESGINYDLNGNILSLQRTMGSATAIDNLTYNYAIGASNTNQLQSVTDAAPDNGIYGYPPGTFAYAYDTNGNLKQDNSKGISNTTYNILNLPNVIILPSWRDTYTYDAAGEKLRKVSTAGTGITTDYVDGVEYDNGVLQFIQNGEGRIMYNSGSPYYEYYLTDHLGDTRLAFDTHASTPTIDQQDDYYPFGYEISRTITNPKNEYLYNKKELQEDLKVYDYGARFYDPLVGRFIGVDPFAEKGRRWSSYTYVFDNPIRFIDPDGMVPTDYYGLGGNYLGNDGVNNGKVEIALTTTTENAITSSINDGIVHVNESTYTDLIKLPTNNEINTMDNRYSTMESNNMNEQAFAVGHNATSGAQSIQTVSSTGNTQSPTGKAEAALASSGNTVDYNGHTHGAVLKYNSTTGVYTVGSMGPSPGDRTGSVFSQPNVVLGYNVQSNTAGITPDEVSNAQSNPNTFVPLNPTNFSKTITFYNQSGDVKALDYNQFKTVVSNIKTDIIHRYLSLIP